MLAGLMATCRSDPYCDWSSCMFFNCNGSHSWHLTDKCRTILMCNHIYKRHCNFPHQTMPCIILSPPVKHDAIGEKMASPCQWVPVTILAGPLLKAHYEILATQLNPCGMASSYTIRYVTMWLTYVSMKDVENWGYVFGLGLKAKPVCIYPIVESSINWSKQSHFEGHVASEKYTKQRRIQAREKQVEWQQNQYKWGALRQYMQSRHRNRQDSQSGNHNTSKSCKGVLGPQ